MGYWHEPRKRCGGWVFPVRDGGRVAVRFVGKDVRKTPFSGCFMRFEGELEDRRKPLRWQHDPAGWFELWPREPILAHSMEEAKALTAPLVAEVEAGTRDHQFEKRPYQPPPKLEPVKEIEHPTHRAKAIVYRRPDGLYDVRCCLHVLLGEWKSASHPNGTGCFEWDWFIRWPEDESGVPLLTLADDLESAEQAALLGLEELVAKDPDVLPRETLND